MYVLSKPLVDLTTLNGIESLYHPGPADPHGRCLAGQLGDMIAYAEAVRFPLPVRSDRPPELPSLVAAFGVHDHHLFEPVQYRTDTQVALEPEYLEPALQQFLRWATAHNLTLAKTVRLHSEAWIRKAHANRVQNKFVYDIRRLQDRAEIGLLARLLDTSEEMVHYTFDVALRYSLYGDLADGQHYLAHPVRDAVKLPTQTESPSEPWKPCITFAKDVEAIASRVSLDDFVAFLMALREQVHRHGLHTLPPSGADIVSREVLREIASTLGLQARFKHITPLLGVSAGLFRAAAAIPAVAVPSALLGGAVTVAAAVWRGHSPRQLGKMRWLRWMVRFDIEDQIEQR